MWYHKSHGSTNTLPHQWSLCDNILIPAQWVGVWCFSLYACAGHNKVRHTACSVEKEASCAYRHLLMVELHPLVLLSVRRSALWRPPVRVRTCMVACLPRRPIGPNSLNSSALRSGGYAHDAESMRQQLPKVGRGRTGCRWWSLVKPTRTAHKRSRRRALLVLAFVPHAPILEKGRSSPHLLLDVFSGLVCCPTGSGNC